MLLLPALALLSLAPAPLLHDPALSRDHVAFSFADELWVAPRAGGPARQITSGAGTKSHPVFSPDGTLIAYTGEVDGNRDVYVLPLAGGPARRLTFHPGPDEAVGFTPDGARVLFRSPRKSWASGDRLLTVPVAGGLAEPLPLPHGFEGSYSADGARLAYVPFTNLVPRRAIKRYRGGLSPRVWLADLADSRITRLPWDGSNDSAPMWIGDKVYFLSDRAGGVTLFVYDVASAQVKQLLAADGEDVLSSGAGPGAIVLERLSGLSLYDLQTGQEKPLAIEVASDQPAARKQWVKAGERITHAALSPSGARVVFEARGDLFTVPAEKGDVRNLTKTSDAVERAPTWSRDGKWIAYFSDQTGEYALYLRRSDNSGEPRRIDLGLPPSFFYDPVFSPDGKRIAYTDKRLQLWTVDVASGERARIDQGLYDSVGDIAAVFSPDSKWLVWSRSLPNHYRALFAHSFESNKTSQLTDGFSDARHPQFDESGKYLYFTASTDSGPTLGWLDLSSSRRPVTSSAYVMVLRKDLPSPLLPESDEEKGADNKKDEKKDEKKEPTRIDLDGLSQRILALPLPARNYAGLRAGKSGVVYLVEAPAVQLDDAPDGVELSLQRFDFAKRKAEKVADGITFFDLSADGAKMLLRKHKKWFVQAADAPADAPKKPDAAPPLRTDEMEAYVDPRAEWKQMYREVWRIQRDFFYDPGLHGVELVEAMERHQKYLDGLTSRRDLDFLFRDMLGELSVQHMYVFPPPPQGEPRKGGLLGADYRIEEGRYRIDRIYEGENWNPGLRSPLTGPGVSVTPGDYILSIDGRELRAGDDIDELLQGTADHTVILKVAKSASGKGAREVPVVPVASDFQLRQRAWMEWNRRKVEELSGGKLAYVYLPNTAGAGLTNFNRYYYAQIDKQGVVIDERFNGGGKAADYIIDQLRRRMLSRWTPRDGGEFTTPSGAIFGPKVMLINQFAGSGGDALPWYFKREKLGPLVGTRTWGGLIGIGNHPPLLDGGQVTSPWFAFYTPEGEWDVENKGVSPDVEIDLDPAEWRRGKDPQLERAVQLALDDLRKNPLPVVKHPAFPNYHKKPAPSAAR